MQVLVDIILPIFGVIGLGYAATFTSLFDDAAAKGLSRFVFFFAIPLMLFSSVAANDLPEHPNFQYLIAYYVGSLASSLLAIAAFRMIGVAPTGRQVMLGFGAGYSNTVLLGIPLAFAAFGEAANLPIFLLISFHAMIFFTAVTVSMEIVRGERSGWRSIALKAATGLVTNVILLALIAGLIVNYSGFGLPGVVENWAELIGRAAIPCALFSMGASLRAYRISGALPIAMAVVAVKLVLHPAIVWVLAGPVFGIASPWLEVAVLCAALPTGINVYLFAVRYGVGEAEAATAIVLSTSLSLVTLTVLLDLLL